MKTQLPNSIKTIDEAKAFLTALHSNNETYHPEDDATDVDWQTTVVSEVEAEQLNNLMRDIYDLQDNENYADMAFDPCDFLLMLDPDYVKMISEDTEIVIPPQVGCIIPIWGNAVNKPLKDFIVWFNENYTVTKR